MTVKRPRVLALGHEATLTGAPLLLLSYIRAAKEMKSFGEFRVLLESGGEITEEYKQVVDTLIVNDSRDQKKLYHQVLYRLDKEFLTGKWSRYRLRKWLEESEPPEIIYVNTVAAIRLLRILLPLLKEKPPVVIHLHELDWMLQKYTSEESTDSIISYCDKFIVPCNAVALSAASLLGVPTNLIEIIPEWVCRHVDVDYYKTMRSEVRKSLGLSLTDILCIGVGKMQWRKGSDLLPLIGSKCLKDNPSIHLAWIGSFSTDERMQAEIDAKKIGADLNIHIIPQQQDPYPYYSGADIYILPSREDPYPVAMLEAGLFGLPVICFDKSGGASEYINNGTGIAVPHLDIEAFASAIQRLSANTHERRRMGEAGRSTVIDKHCAVLCIDMITRCLLSSIGET